MYSKGKRGVDEFHIDSLSNNFNKNFTKENFEQKSV